MGGQITERPGGFFFPAGERRQPGFNMLLDGYLFVGAATRMAGFHPRLQTAPESAGVIRKLLPLLLGGDGLVGERGLELDDCGHDGFLSTLGALVYVRLGDGLGGPDMRAGWGVVPQVPQLFPSSVRSPPNPRRRPRNAKLDGGCGIMPWPPSGGSKRTMKTEEKMTENETSVPPQWAADLKERGQQDAFYGPLPPGFGVSRMPSPLSSPVLTRRRFPFAPETI